MKIENFEKAKILIDRINEIKVGIDSIEKSMDEHRRIKKDGREEPAGRIYVVERGKYQKILTNTDNVLLALEILLNREKERKQMLEQELESL